MAKYAFLFIDDGVDYQTNPTPEQQAVYGQIFKWFETNGSKMELQALIAGAHADAKTWKETRWRDSFARTTRSSR